MNQRIVVIESSDCDQFTKDVNALLEQGYKIESSSCGFVDSEKYNFCGSYQMILSIETI